CSRDLEAGWRLEAQLSSYETWGEMILVLRKDSSATASLPVASPYPEWDISQMDLSLGELLPGAVLEQSFEIQLKSLSAVEIRFGTYGRHNSGTLDFRLFSGDEREPLVRQQLDVGALRDNVFHRFEFSPTPSAVGASFRLTLQVLDSKPDNAITVWCARNADPRLRLSINGATREGVALNFKSFAATRLFERGMAPEDDAQRSGTKNGFSQPLGNGRAGRNYLRALAGRVKRRLTRL